MTIEKVQNQFAIVNRVTIHANKTLKQGVV